MYPCDVECYATPGLCTYYAIASLLVIVLAISLIWFPFVQLISEINTIIAKVIIYFNNEFLGWKNCYLDGIESLLICPTFLILISICCLSYILYLASSDFLISAACYISTLPDTAFCKCLKKKVLKLIETLLKWQGQKLVNQKRRTVRFDM